MKKSILFFGMVLTCVFVLTACQTPNVANYPSQGVGQQQENLCIPEWVKNPNDTADAIYGTGEAKLRNHALTMEAADGRARTQIVKTIKTKIDARFKDFMQESGVGEEAQSLQFVEALSKQISSDTLHGCKIIKREFCPDGKIWSLAMLPLNEVDRIKALTKQKANDFVVNKKALYNEFKSKQAFDDFQKDLDALNFKE
ncbi:MAG: LPP20 family lipoprotein [Candidatus Magnetomorum sp.]|nr:LPP20 family lipoprotein [Candidatus Magnetomorum sp.]